MYAIIKSGSKQYRVRKNEEICVELLDGEPGEQVVFRDVLFYHDGESASLGAPIVSDLSVKGEILSTEAGPKITSVKYIPGNRYKKFGHRQKYTRVKITDIAKS